MGNDHPTEKPLIFKQVLRNITLRNTMRTVWRICILILGCKGLNITVYMGQKYLLLHVTLRLIVLYKRSGKQLGRKNILLSVLI